MEAAYSASRPASCKHPESLARSQEIYKANGRLFAAAPTIDNISRIVRFLSKERREGKDSQEGSVFSGQVVARASCSQK